MHPGQSCNRSWPLAPRQAELIAELEEALVRVKTLEGIIPICASCKSVRDDTGYWQQVEVYVRDHSHADFSHSICPDCFKDLYPEYECRRNKTG